MDRYGILLNKEPPTAVKLEISKPVQKMVELCGDCECVNPKEKRSNTGYHQCTKYKVRLYHLGHHPDLVRASICDKDSQQPLVGA